jgi:hypothetical protein
VKRAAYADVEAFRAGEVGEAIQVDQGIVVLVRKADWVRGRYSKRAPGVKQYLYSQIAAGKRVQTAQSVNVCYQWIPLRRQMLANFQQWDPGVDSNALRWPPILRRCSKTVGR